ncbi:MAG TPA: hypothetical protein ENJ18_15475 [Nannocystis exedens]|nr:hypothetical protein [Nannocystis exedens]
MSRSPQLLLAALVFAPWITIHARDMRSAQRLGQTREATAKIGEIIAAVAIYQRADGPQGRRCPHPQTRPSGRAGPTPPLDVICHEGPDEHCLPVTSETVHGPGYYPAELWSATSMWQAIGFRMTHGHAFHYSIETRDLGDRCAVTIEASADLDGDGEHSLIRARATLGRTRATIDEDWELDSALE